MRAESDLNCEPISWQGRQGFLLENDVIWLVTLTGGGHIVEFQLRGGRGRSTMNPLWVPPGKTIEPYCYREAMHARTYGAASTGKTLSGIAGHNLCLDYFGGASSEEVRQGLSIHGEAPNLRWQKLGLRATRRRLSLELGVRLPATRLYFRRSLKLCRGESIVYIRETVENEAKIDHLFYWTQHVTLGPPFLDSRHSRVFISGKRGRTAAGGYEGRELLDSARDFSWPEAPGRRRKTVDIRQPFVQAERGFVATVLLDPGRSDGYVAALNAKERLLVGYSFSRHDFPWAAVWEENKARTEAPWKGQTQARGLEFGSTPFPVGRREASANGPLFDTPHFSVVPARSRTIVDYVAFLAEAPAGLWEVDSILRARGEIRIKGRGHKNSFAEVRVRAAAMTAHN